MSDVTLEIGVGDTVTLRGVGDARVCQKLRDGLKVILRETTKQSANLSLIQNMCVELLSETKSTMIKEKEDENRKV